MSHVSPTTLPRLHALGVELNTAPDKFGFMRETAPADDDGAILRERMQEDGYLFLRGFRSRDQVQAVRDSLTAQLERLQFLRPGFPRDEARSIPGREVGRAMGNPLDQQDPALRELLFGQRTMAFFQKFLGGPVAHFDFVWFRTKGTGLGSPIHCDLVYMGRGTHALYTMWVPLGDVPLEMGGLLILEESHKKSAAIQAYLSRDVDAYCSNQDDAAEFAEGRKWWDGTLSKNPLALQESLGGRWLTAENFRLGDVVIFNMTLVHGSLDNQTDRIRLSTDTRYQLAS
ncbi:MAG: phytanoyl-CoA dioxygenase family protein, partial [Verrucomicrobiota bacterium]